MSLIKTIKYSITWTQSADTPIRKEDLYKLASQSAGQLNCMRLDILEKNLENSKFTETNNLLKKFQK